MSILIKILGVILLLVGLALSWSPIPLGILLIPVGAAMIVATSSHAQKWLRGRRENNPKFDRWMGKMQRKAPDKVSSALEGTEPRGNG
ncbi:hypothetical protein FKB34_05785 [Glycocaulis profundi]|nr:hypothetical protein FKB34_05785 [Glycocaulis profundi]